MIRVNIALQPRPYDALIENGLLERAGDLVSAVFGLDARDSPSKLTRARGFIVTVAPVRRRWGKKLMDSLSRAGFAAQMLEPMASSPEEFAVYMRSMTQSWAKIIREQGLTIQ